MHSLRPLIDQMRYLLPCQLCGLGHQRAHALCDECWQDLPWLNEGKLHTLERNELKLQVALEYAFPIDKIIQQYKYEEKLYFQTLLAHTLQSLRLPRVQAIVPMPISTERLAERGYNQMLVIARQLSKYLDIPVWQPVVRKAQHSQKGLSRVERMENIEHQFEMIRTERRKFRKVLVIDDVITTGSSLKALVQTLEKGGCSQIHLACIAAAKL